jgi:L-threonylcarbamoyladenylate synthase
MAELLGPDDIEVACAALERGRLVAFPTETVYGLGADASSPAAVERIFRAKGRPRGHPLIVHVADAGGLDRLGRDVSDTARALADAFWPGPLTLIVGRGQLVAAEATGGRPTVGLRVPDHPVALALLRAFGRGVAGPSANRFGSVSPTTAAHVIDDLGDVIDYVLDGGPCRVGLESTIVDVSGPAPTVLRPGGISAVEIEAVIGVAPTDGRGGPARAPGMLASHYAPDVAVELVEADRLDRAIDRAVDRAGGRPVGVIAPFGHDHTPSWVLPADAAGYGARLYGALREADGADLARLLVVPPDRGRLLDAVLDRLVKAAAPRPVTGS